VPKKTSCTTLALLPSREETTSIIGSTGSGKSTLVNLVRASLTSAKAAILIDGIDISAM
jgi:ABC-type multidrug transport system fused ATPase/permease subunit